MEIQKVLVLSTAHLPQKEFENLFADSEMPYRFIDHKHGSILVVTMDDINNYDYSNKPALKPILEYAVKNEIYYIDFDEDGNEVKEFETFDW